jgi:hypothetical protein
MKKFEIDSQYQSKGWPGGIGNCWHHGTAGFPVSSVPNPETEVISGYIFIVLLLR